jgi:hypothetical protein
MFGRALTPGTEENGKMGKWEDGEMGKLHIDFPISPFPHFPIKLFIIA